MDKEAASRAGLDMELGGVVGIVRRRWLLAVGVFVATVAIAGVAATLAEDRYLASAKLLFRTDRTATLTGVGEGVAEFDPLVRTQNPLVTEIEVMTSRPLLEQVVEELGLTGPDGTPRGAGSIRRHLQVEILGGADVLKVSYEAGDPEEAAAIVNTLAEAYIEANVIDNRAKASQARELIESQLPQAESFVQESEGALRNFKEANRVVAIEQEAESVVRVMQDLDTQILSTQAALQEATTRVEELQQQLGLGVDEALVVSDLSQSPGVQGVLQDLQAAERSLASQRGFYTDESPDVITAQGEVESLRSLLREEVARVAGRQTGVPSSYIQTGQTRQGLIAEYLASEVSRQSLASRLAALNGAQAAYRSRSDVLPRLEQQQAQLQRKLEVARLNYQTLLQRLQELRVAENQVEGNARIIEAAEVPHQPQTDQQTITILVGVLLGICLAATVVFILELMDGEAQRQLGVERKPALGPVEHSQG
ncbi:MAG: GumC family protein [Synechococcales bacterium]|nr:GumC family protein [Synechococcales bacterium]